MRRFWKISLAVIGTLAGVGLVSILLGGLFGGMAQAARMLKDGIHDRAPFSRDAAAVYGQDGRPENEYPGPGDAVYEDLEAAWFHEVSDIHIEIDHCEADIVLTEADTFGIRAGDIEQLQCYLDGDTWIVSADNKEYTDQSRLLLYIPEKAVLDRVEIEVGGAELTAQRLTADAFSLQAGAGSLEIDGLRADSAQIQVGVGEMEITDGVVTDLVIEAGMGNFSYQGSIRGNAEAECGMGNIELAVEGAPEDFNYETEGMLGNIVIGDDNSIPALFGDSLDNGADKSMDLICAMGQIEITFYENGGNRYE